ncbi:NAD-dependent epimerase/dehydratase family protein [Flavobacterium psychrotolerans]|uniref:NAD-dependent dehydratase n=1 Tax=Flavobacterium psychrotolerans TaxID=2169410 RepID=A0A2U1JFX2_9FLAO|nr:NAD-dependent epimerase/dehydratase family protein [Flavobacterium psychrotolerans]PWA04042.1 NAD-dependent dehydratase [Flavobacterium psychrotolerans]
MTFNNSKILITGGFGALGYNLIQYLTGNYNCSIHVIDNFSAGHTNFSNEVTFSYIDIGNTEKLNIFLKNYQPNYVFHLAAHFANQNSVDHPLSDISTNVVGLVNLFEAQRSNKELKKIIFASSSCVYGNSEIMTEDLQVSPHDTPYAINKYVGELYSKYYAEIHHIPVVSARIFNSYGPGEMPGQYRNVIPNFIKSALLNETINITGTGEETRDFTYVEDTIDLLIKLATSKYHRAEVFNGGTGTKLSIKNLAEEIIRLTESQSKIVFTEPRNWDHVKDRCSSIEKSQTLLGYHPSHDFRTGLAKTIDWIKGKL